MKFKSIALAAVLFAAFSTTTQAQTIVKKQRNEVKRIKQGVQSGEVTKGEAVVLAKEQKNIQQEKKAAKADGVVTPAERQDIRQDQRKASRHIYRAKHNNRDRN